MTPRARARSVVRGGWQWAVAFASDRSLKLFILLGIPYFATIASLGSYLLHGGTGPPTQVEFGLLVVAMLGLLVNAFGGNTV